MRRGLPAVDAKKSRRSSAVLPMMGVVNNLVVYDQHVALS
jgi:hypothetical protein